MHSSYVMTRTHIYIYAVIHQVFKEPTITFIKFTGIQKMLASARGREGSTAATARARESTASVARGAEIPVTILELKSVTFETE